jgi:hypothetical protein
MMHSSPIQGMTAPRLACEPSGDTRRKGARYDGVNGCYRIGAKPRRRANRHAAERLAVFGGSSHAGFGGGLCRLPVGVACMADLEGVA